MPSSSEPARAAASSPRNWPAGLSVVLLERGSGITAADCRKDDLRNQRTSVLGNNSVRTTKAIRGSWWT